MDRGDGERERDGKGEERVEEYREIKRERD